MCLVCVVAAVQGAAPPATPTTTARPTRRPPAEAGALQRVALVLLPGMLAAHLLGHAPADVGPHQVCRVPPVHRAHRGLLPSGCVAPLLHAAGCIGAFMTSSGLLPSGCAALLALHIFHVQRSGGGVRKSHAVGCLAPNGTRLRPACRHAGRRPAGHALIPGAGHLRRPVPGTQAARGSPSRLLRRTRPASLQARCRCAVGTVCCCCRCCRRACLPGPPPGQRNPTPPPPVPARLRRASQTRMGGCRMPSLSSSKCWVRGKLVC